MRKLKIILLSFSLALICIVPSTLKAYDFEGNETYYINYCSVPLKTQEDADLCAAFKRWYEQKAEDLMNNANSMQESITNLQGEIEAVGQQMAEYQRQLDDLALQIQALNESIAQIEANMAVLQEEIEMKEEEIAMRDAQIKEGMVAMQSYVGVNAYVDIIMGASDIVDLIRRVSVLQDITSYEQSQIQALDEAIEELDFDKKELERLKQEQEDNRRLAEEQRALLDQLNQQMQEKYNLLRAQQEDLINQQREMAQASESILSQLPALNETVVGNYQGSNGFVIPVQGNWSRSAGTWAYDGTSTVHLGYDFAAAIGTTVVAPCNAIVLYANNPSATNGGYYGNREGWPYGGGNTISLVGQVNGTTYMFSFFHLAQSPWFVSAGDTVNAGQQIAAVGHSGNSTGPHLHFEIINMGSMSISEVYNNFKLSADFSGGTGWSSTATSCNSKGFAPCRERPEDLLGI